MSARFWMFSMASAGVALASGLGLGLYATTPPQIAMSSIEAPHSATADSEAQPDGASLNGPAEIRCTGCGPTLADRQMVATMGGWDGYSDPAVRDYERQGHEAPEDLLADVPDPTPSPAHQLPANVERFAAGDTVLTQAVQMAQTGANPAVEDYQTAVPDRF